MAFFLKWDETGEKLYETGVDRGVIYPITNGTYGNGVAWNGLRQVDESPSGAEPTNLYANNHKYLSLMSVEELGLTIGAYMSPEEFDACDGTKEIATGVYIKQQNRKHFGFTYRSLIGNDDEGTDYGYKIHIIYDCLASPSERSHSTVNDSPEASELSWSVTTTAVDPGVADADRTCAIEIDSTKISSAALTSIENALYGNDSTPATLPSITQILEWVGAGGATGATGETNG